MINDDIRAYIDTLGLFSSCLVDFLTEESSICLRHEPSESVETRYMDGSRQGNFNFGMYVKSDDLEQCINTCNLLVNGLDLGEYQLTSETRITCIPTSSASIVEKSENGYYVYVVSFNLKYFIER